MLDCIPQNSRKHKSVFSMCIIFDKRVSNKSQLDGFLRIFVSSVLAVFWKMKIKIAYTNDRFHSFFQQCDSNCSLFVQYLAISSNTKLPGFTLINSLRLSSFATEVVIFSAVSCLHSCPEGTIKACEPLISGLVQFLTETRFFEK